MNPLATISSIMQSLIDVTRSLCAMIERDELERLPEVLEERERLLNEQRSFVQRWSASKEELASHIGASVTMLQQLDRDFVTLFTKKKEEAAERLKQATNQKMLLAYSR